MPPLFDTFVILLIVFVAGAFLGYCLRRPMAKVPNPSPTTSADKHYWVMGGDHWTSDGGPTRLAFTDEQIEVAAQRAAKLHL